MKQPVVLIKLGGSLITNKSKPFSERREVISDLVAQIKKAWESGEVKIIVGHGGGSYPHVPAEKYRTIEGVVDEESVYGAAVVEDAAAQLNRIVVSEFLKQKVPAVSVNPSSLMVANGIGPESVYLDSIQEMLELNIIPVIYGDVVFKKEVGFTIWSTEQLLNMLAFRLQKQGRLVAKVIHCGETDGFLVGGKVLPKISLTKRSAYRKHVTKTQGFDVTGGMLHKVEQALETAEAGIDSYIVGGNHGGNLYRAIVGDDFVGTKITRD
jgi:isopentenyl phosphate kinase